jgi:diaminopimelate epimerase
MRIPFSKMQGAGNDFIVLNNIELRYTGAQLSQLAKQLCQRKLSIGADAVMAVDTAEAGGDFRMRFYNADGTEAEMCGNGARCIARFAYEGGLAQAEMTIETVAGPVKAWRLNKRLYRILLNHPSLVEQELVLPLADGTAMKANYVELGHPGLPHAVVEIQNLADYPLADLRLLGRELRFHRQFPKGANVNFYDVQADGQILLRTYERGVEDITLACGTGSGATALIATLKKQVKQQPVVLNELGGILKVEVTPEHDLYLIGDTNRVTEGFATDEDGTVDA